ncbi:MAG: polysaccharide deacetylase family protein [Bacillota bacterium]|nr:polysaccharide deacetylase family protein [Bacillota bacterium]
MRKFIVFLALALVIVFSKTSYASDQIEDLNKKENIKQSETQERPTSEQDSETEDNEVDEESEEVEAEETEENEDLVDEQPISYEIHPNARPVPVLMFHDVGYIGVKSFSDANFIFKDNLERKLKILIKNGYTTITSKDLYDNWIYGKELPEKPVLLSFDDGYASHFSYVQRMFTRLDIKATFYIIQDRLFMDMPGRDLKGLRDLVESGQEIGVHTYSHKDFTDLTYDEIYQEVATCKNFLEEELGTKLDTFSYPYGNYNDAAIQVLKDLGFRTAVTTREGLGRPDQFEADNVLKISRYNIFNSTTDQQFQKMIDGLK